MKKRYLVLSGLLCAALLVATAGCGKDEGGTQSGGTTGGEWYDKEIWMTQAGGLPTEEIRLPTSASLGSDVAVHDPSVFYDDVTQKYYAFGTHFAVASSTDLVTWKQEATDGASGRTLLYGDDVFTGVSNVKWPLALKKSVEAANIQDKGSNTISTTWAPDVMKIDGRYYMYYSITDSFGSSRSLIGRVSSKDVLGPYADDEIIVQSYGMNGQPNCIDPELFYDKEGNLYMVYGSFFTGIFIKELNKNGLPVVTDEKAENYYGTLVWQGGSVKTGGKVVEGPFVFYNAETDYYYLMTTYGDLESDYNMRVARSKTPMGPYSDVADNLLTVYSDALGVKLAGNYQFKGGTTKTALGHNSVIKKDGKYLLVCHVRNAIKGMHHVEVHQLFFNKDGWPVMSPDRYVGESAGTVTAEKLAGSYDVIVHTAGTDSKYAASVSYSLTADGKIMDSSQKEAGTWSLEDGCYCTITLGGITYKGVVAPGWKEYGTPKGVYCMTATSDAGLPIWLNGN